MVFDARGAALGALRAYRVNKAWPDRALDGIIRRSKLSALDVALAKRILDGVLQNMLLCDHYIAHFSSVGIRKIEPGVLDILRLSVYQILFLDKVPPSAAVNEGVALAKKTANPRAAGYVNAVLRAVARANENKALPEVGGGEVQRLSVMHSHPEWLVRELSSILDPEAIEAFLAANNDAGLPVYAQVNTLLTDTDSVLDMLAADGVEALRHAWLEGCALLYGARDIARLNAFAKGLIYIQDVAARLAVIAAGPKPGDFIIDGCAAPGGKSFASAIAMENKGKIISCDIQAKKLRLVEEGAKGLGISIIEVIECDASAPTDEFYNKADVVLADVPCSGFGVIRKRPEIRYKPESEIAGLPDIQKSILSGLSAYVKPGGVLLYSTCTLLKRENEGVIKWFLHENCDFHPERFSLPGIGHVDSGMLTLWPHIHGTDGFFICKLRNCQ